MQLYSNAFNTDSYLHGGFDFATGQYNSMFQLAVISPEGPGENGRAIRLRFSMAAQGFDVYGLGWQLGNTEFNEQSLQLRLLSGERYTTGALPAVGAIVPITDKKLKDMVFKRIAENTLHVIYKDGVIEVLDRIPGNLFMLSQIIFETGESFRVSYNAAGLLSMITNEQSNRRILRMEYERNHLVRADVLKDEGRIACTYFTYDQNKLHSISIPFQEGNELPEKIPVYAYEYQVFADGTIGLREFSNPLGGRDIVEYQERGHVYFANESIPFVKRITSESNSDAPNIVKEYAYSQHNFTGYPVVKFDGQKDNLYFESTEEYEYWIRELTLDQLNILQLKHVYFNRFHLLVREHTTRSGKQFDKQTKYNDKPGLPFSEQPENMQLPREIRYQYVANSRSRIEEETIETDDFGNPKLHISTTGIRHTFSYFPIEGEQDRCPPEPHGFFVRFVSEEKIEPAFGDSSTVSTSFTYTALAQFRRGGNFVVRESSFRHASYQPQCDVQNHFSYGINQTQIALHGRLHGSTVSVAHYPPKRSIFGFRLEGEILHETRAILTEDGQASIVILSTSVVNKALLAVRNELHVEVITKYGVDGKICLESISPGSASEATRTYHYAYFPFRVETHDAVGGHYITIYDGFGKHTSTLEMRENHAKIIRSSAYNRLGQLVAVTEIDEVDDDANADLSLVTSYQYDGWGLLNKTIRPDGSVFVTDYDPIDQVRFRGTLGSSMIRTVENKFNKPERTEQVANGAIGTDGVLLLSQTYDGFGRCTFDIDQRDNSTGYDYNALGHLLSLRNRSSADSDQVLNRLIQFYYSRQESDPLIERMVVDTRIWGQTSNQTFDGLGRITSKEFHDSKEAISFEYSGGAMRPTSTTMPSSGTTFYRYDSQHGELLQISNNQGSISNFQRDQKTGALLGATNRNFGRVLQVDDYGRVTSDRLQFSGQTQLNTFHFSRAGRLLSGTTSLGNTETYEYDKAGRFSNVQIDDSNCKIEYDSFGRIQVTTITTPLGTLSTRLIYDQFGRVATRESKLNDALLQTQRLTYHFNGLIASRHQLDAQNQSVIYETFVYDMLSRLTEYHCSGPEYPTDKHSRSVQYQYFEFNGIHNIVKVKTGFVDGTEDISDRFFESGNPSRLTRVTHSLPAEQISLSYDDDGNLRNDGTFRYEYNDLNRLSEVFDISTNTAIASYRYDASGRLIQQINAQAEDITLHVSGGRVSGLVEQEGGPSRFIFHQAEVLATNDRNNTGTLHVTDADGSVRAVLDSALNLTRVHYLPYGQSTIDLHDPTSSFKDNRPRFKSERFDSVAKLYHFGNGMRAYNPELMIFLTPDPLSPFTQGALNSYSYCNGDPINRSDPSGLLSNWDWVKIGIGATLLAATLFFAIPAVIAAGVSVAGAFALASVIGATVSFSLSTSSTVLAFNDSRYGTDHTRLIHGLNIGALTFGLIGLGGGIASAVRAGMFTGVSLAAVPEGSYALQSIPAMSAESGLTIFSESSQAASFVGSNQAGLRFIATEFFNSLMGIDEVAESALTASPILFARMTSAISLIDTVYSSISGGVDLWRESHPAASKLQPIVTEFPGALKSLHTFNNEFDSQSRRIRSSARFN